MPKNSRKPISYFINFRPVLICLLIASFSVFAQKKQKIDSLKAAFQSEKPSKHKAQLSLDIVQYFSRNNNDSNAKYLEVSKIAVMHYGDTRMKARNKLDFANHLRNIGNFDQGIKINQEAIKLYESIGDFQGMGAGYNSLGVTFKVLGNDKNELQSYVEKALKYSMLSREYYEKAKDNDGLLRIYSNIGTMYRDLKRYSDAEKSYLDGLAIAKKSGIDNYSVGVLYSNLGQIYMDYYKNYDKSIAYLKKALANYQKNEIYNYQEHVFRNLAFNYTKKGDYSLAIDYAKKALAIAQESHDPQQKINSYAALIEAQQKADFHKEAFENLSFQKNLEDSVLSIEKTSIIAEMDAKFETIKKDAAIKILNKSAELDKIKSWSLIFVIILLTTGGTFVYYTITQKRKSEIKIAQQEKIIEQKKLLNAEQELEFKKKELTAKVLQLARKNEFLGSLENEVGLLKSNVDSSVEKASNRIKRLIIHDIADEKQWEQFSKEFSGVHQGFIDALFAKFGEFSKSEIRLISLLKMNLSSKEIANMLNISDDGIKKARYRLRKKLNLDHENDLQGFLLSFAGTS